jgi:hypothetical protein
MAAKYGNPIVTETTNREYRYRWTYSGGVWLNVPYQYRNVVTLEYRQMCTRDYTKEAIGAPGTGYELVSSNKISSRGPFAELVSVWKSLSTLSWTTIT